MKKIIINCCSYKPTKRPTFEDLIPQLKECEAMAEGQAETSKSGMHDMPSSSSSTSSEELVCGIESKQASKQAKSRIVLFPLRNPLDSDADGWLVPLTHLLFFKLFFSSRAVACLLCGESSLLKPSAKETTPFTSPSKRTRRRRSMDRRCQGAWMCHSPH